MSSSAATTPCRGAMKPAALTPTVVVTPSSMSSELSPSMMSCSNVSSSLMMSTSKYSSSEPPVLVRTLCLVGRDVQGDKEVVRAADKLGLSLIKSESGQEHVNSGDAIGFVVHDFTGASFDLLRGANCTLFGPTAVKEAAAQQPPQHLIMSDRPLFATSMRGFGVHFHGYNHKHYKEDVRKYLFWINSLGGSVVPKVDSHKKKVTHLVARHCRGQDYTYASTFDIPILQDRWLAEAWERRYEMNFSADRTEFQSQWKVKPFHGAYIHFLGFPEEERVHMVSELTRNGGRECVDYRRDRCTHVVVDGGGEVSAVPADVPKEAHVVKVEWFWASIQMDACAQENLHLFSEYVESFLSPARNGAAANYFSPTTPGSHGRRKKRRTEALKQLAQSEQLGVPQQVPSTSKKSRSSVGDLGELCVGQGGGSGGSFLDTPDKHKAVPLLPPTAAAASASDPKSPAAVVAPPLAPPSSKKQLFSARQQVFAELLQTEENYVGILNTILEVFRDPLEKTSDNPKMQLLNQTQIKIIFGNVPPILDVHTKMLAEFRVLMRDWKEAESSIGTVLLRYAQDLMRAYPPFVNFFENTKRTLEECDKANPRFHAFLKVCQSRRECGRQTLAELLIRPVQRLGSVCLLLNDLLKHTRKEREHPDAPALESALGKVKEVLTNINEDKRKTEGRVHIFEIFSDIENCPPHLVSSNRNFLCKADVVELGGSDELSGKGSDLSLFLFNDVLEISKKRRHYQNSGRAAGGGNGGGSFSGVRSPSTLSLRKASVTAAGSGSDNPGGGGGGGQGGTLQRGGEGKLHKHINLMSLTSIRRVVDLDDGEESRDCFALICRTNQELKERMFVFQFISSDCDNGGLPNKEEYLRQLCRNIANTMYRPDPDAYLVRMRPDDLGLTTSDLTASRNYRSMYKVKKVFSFNRTPTTSRLTRAVSSMISPLTASNGGHNLNNAQSGSSNRRATPSGDLQNLKLQSCTNLATAAEESPRSSRNYRTMTMCSMPPPASPSTRSVASSNGSSSDAEQHSPTKRDNKNQFALPRTPNFVSRRSSFKFLSSSLGKKF